MVHSIRLYIVLLSLALIASPMILTEACGQEPSGNSGLNVVKSDNVVNKMKDSVLSYFYPASGTIAEVDKESVKVILKTGEGLKNGMRFSVFREGKPFYHPITKELIGKSETFTGRIEITGGPEEPGQPHKDGGLYMCRIVNGSPEAGDQVRITASGINLAFFQDKDAHWSLSETLYNALKDSGRFNLKGSYAKTYDAKELSNQARALGAEVILFFSTTVKDDDIFLNTKLIWPEDGKVFSEVQEKVDQNLAREIETTDNLISISSIDEEPWGRYRLQGGELIAMGDVDGNGEKELIVSDGNTIRIYEFRQEPHEIWSIKGNSNEKHLSISTLDLNENGRDEIFITSFADSRPNADLADSEMKRKKSDNNIMSFALEYNPPDGYKRIWEKNSYAMRVIGKTLLMQKFTPDRAFTGPVFKGILKDRDYTTGSPLELPGGVEIYGFTYVDWQNSGHAHVLTFNNRGYLNLYDGNELIWSSKSSYGKFDSFAQKSYSVPNQDTAWVMKERLITIKSGQGDEVIAVKKVPFLNRLESLGYKKSEVYSLRWDGETMEETLVAGEINGTVTDYWIEGNNLILIARPNMYLVLKKSLSGDLMKGSILYYYSIAGE